ncbi:hypothetical protein RFI_21401 [Reticulomyxa filosa]|uniref:Uncharacterized protein n=1 Tax=Reticulomyxa filosa TaxID=46433 RepID=X6MQ50_RETFI|nr:hypothetical protein RFI_21401 [Reticulomyxa filosa]|eukprot:ETO15959.1 hypothetical protein RFI_21401 [Reticulomyxa filosa]
MRFAFKEMYDKDVIETILQNVKRSDDEYHRFVENALRGAREEEDPDMVDEKGVSNDNEALRNAFADPKKVDMSIIIDIFSTRSWGHLDRVLVEFNKLSALNAKATIEKRIGGRVGNAIQIIIDVAQQRHVYWAQTVNTFIFMSQINQNKKHR